MCLLLPLLALEIFLYVHHFASRGEDTLSHETFWKKSHKPLAFYSVMYVTRNVTWTVYLYEFSYVEPTITIEVIVVGGRRQTKNENVGVSK